MTTERANLIATIGVLAGLVLVAYELRQNNEIAEAESFRTMWEMVGEMSRLRIETDIMTLYRTSIENPSSLSDDDVYRLSAYLSLGLEIQVLKAVMRDSYGLYPVSVESQALDISGTLLYGPFGRAWWENNENWVEGYHPALARAISEHLSQVPVLTDYGHGDELRVRATQIRRGE